VQEVQEVQEVHEVQKKHSSTKFPPTSTRMSCARVCPSPVSKVTEIHKNLVSALCPIRSLRRPLPSSSRVVRLNVARIPLKISCDSVNDSRRCDSRQCDSGGCEGAGGATAGIAAGSSYCV
jgi:hypothetical protein